MITPTGVGVVAEVTTFVEVAAFIALYWRSIEWRDDMARHIMAFMAVIGAVLMLSLIRISFHLDPDSGWFEWLRVCTFCLFPLVVGQRIWKLLHVNRKRDQ